MKYIIEANKKEIKSNKQDSDEKIMKLTEYIKAMVAAITHHINSLKFSPTEKDSLNPLDPTTVVPAKMMAPTLDSGQFTKSGGIWNLKHDIISPKLFELLIKIELKRGHYSGRQ